MWYDRGPSGYRHEFFPSGSLCISVNNYYSWDGLRRNWQDSSRKQLEDGLEKVIVGFIKLSLKEKADNQKREEEKRLRQEMIARKEAERRQSEEIQKIIDLEQSRVSGLIKAAEDWRKSKLIREFVAAVEQKLLAGGCHYHSGCDWDEWLQWAKERAERLDPLSFSPSSIIDESAEEE